MSVVRAQWSGARGQEQGSMVRGDWPGFRGERCQGSGVRGQGAGSGLRPLESGARGQVSGARGQGSGLRSQRSEVRGQGSGFKVHGSGSWRGGGAVNGIGPFEFGAAKKKRREMLLKPMKAAKIGCGHGRPCGLQIAVGSLGRLQAPQLLRMLGAAPSSKHVKQCSCLLKSGF